MTTAFVIAAVLIFCLGLFAALVDRTNQRDDALGLLAASEAECVELARVARVAAEENAELDQENMRLHLELSEAQLLAGTVRVPSLRVVPNGGKVMSADGYRCCGHCADDPVHAVGTDRHEVPCNAPNSQGCIGRTYATDPEVTL